MNYDIEKVTIKAKVLFWFARIFSVISDNADEIATNLDFRAKEHVTLTCGHRLSDVRLDKSGKNRICIACEQSED